VVTDPLKQAYRDVRVLYRAVVHTKNFSI